MAYIVPIHKPSSIRYALKLNFFNDEETCLVVAKANTLDFYTWTGDGIVLRSSTTIYGRITMLARLRPASATSDHLFISTDRYLCFTISWDPKTRSFRTESKYVNLTEGGARDTQTVEKCLIDPSGRFMALEYFEGIINVIPIIRKVKGKRKAGDSGHLGESVQARIPELFVRSMGFLHGSKFPKLALLWEDGHQKVHLTAKHLEYTPPGPSDSGSVEFTDTGTVVSDLEDRGADHIIPVPEPVRGLIILGGLTITYVDDTSNATKSISLSKPTVFVTWASMSDERYILADDYGKLYLLELAIIEKAVVRDMHVKNIGTASRATCLVPLSDDHIFLGSHQGDSQVIKVDLHHRSVQPIQSISNIAPILDFTIMDLGSRAGEVQMNEYSSGQARIVTGSGAFHAGSLRSVRSGVGLEDQGILAEIDGIRDLFSLRSSSSTEFVDTLVVSILDETRIFEFSSEGEIEELDKYKGFLLTESTLVAANVPGDRMIQITTSSVRLVDAERGTLLSQWKPPKTRSITDASANDDRILLSVGGTSLVVLDLGAELAVIAQKNLGNDSQIACVTVPSVISGIGIIGIWQGASISIVDLATLDILQTEVVGEPGEASVPRKLLVAQMLANQPPTLFVAMADGAVVTFSVNAADFSLSAKRSTILGMQEAKLQALPRGDGLSHIFATCEHPSLIYGSERRLIYSAVTANEAVCVCNFNTEAYPGSIMVATPKELKIALIDEERRTHVRDLYLGETAHRVAYSTKLKAFGVGTIRRTLEDGNERIKSHIKLVDEVLFDLLDTYDLNEDELVETVIRAEMNDSVEDGPAERFIVGTGYIDDEREEPVRGRIIIFEVDDDRKLKVVTEKAVKGACRCLSILNGNIVTALSKTVVLYSLNYNSARPSLVKRATYRASNQPIDLAVTGNLIAVADVMKSLAIVEYKPGENGLSGTLDEVARHYQTVWSTAVAHVAEDTFLESDAQGNLMVLHQNRNGVTEDDQRRLEVTGEMQLGELVNRIRRTNIPTSPEAVVIPRAFLATIDGAMYLFALISPKRQDLLMRLQMCMADHVQSLGRIPFSLYRAFRSFVREGEEPYRFVDGELIEKFLNCSDDLQSNIAEELGEELDTLRVMVEGLRRLR
ncbi:MAG: DNA damage-binding protein 1 [Peltula sp. TS41687]|nr:MAG: DNA damage-binding protein 1 [Peltula sp. TS41687]